MFFVFPAALGTVIAILFAFDDEYHPLVRPLPAVVMVVSLVLQFAFAGVISFYVPLAMQLLLCAVWWIARELRDI